MVQQELFAKRLRKLRRLRALSLGALSERAGVAKSTLSKWESGRFQPRLPELTAVLDALRVTESERNRLIGLMDAPRATRYLDALSGPPTLPVRGRLLRAIRRRNGLSQEQAAAFLNVHPTTISAWEQARALPPSHRCDDLLRVLGAYPEERQWFTCDTPPVPALVPPELFDIAGVSAKEMFRKERFYCYFSQFLDRHGDISLQEHMDASFLWFEGWATSSGGDDAETLPFRIWVWARYSQFLVCQGRYEEGIEYARQALQRSKEIESADLPDMAVARAARAFFRAVAQRDGAHSPHRAYDLTVRREKQGETPQVSGWFLSDMGLFRAQMGEAAEGVCLGECACEVAESVSESEWRHRRAILAQLLVRAGHPDAALNIIPDSEDFTPSDQIKLHLVRAEAFAICGDPTNSEVSLRAAYALITRYCQEPLRPLVDSAATRLLA
ncbi:MAG: hypothetical protein OHK0029_16550 [Armatimonadaceae bacterium]